MKHPHIRRIVQCMPLLLAILFFPIQSSAQQTLGSLNGTVVDPTGSAVSGAKVTVTNSAINFSQTTTTQQSGFFRYSISPSVLTPSRSLKLDLRQHR